MKLQLQVRSLQYEQITLLTVIRNVRNSRTNKITCHITEITDERLMTLSLKYFTTNEEVEISGSHGGNKITVF